ncbi:hypothetical protein BV20DRAFT_983889 [Pilatotrama ljubarskyi]|nr:hypothetical protein BV20DRAFT_983889 [Pilatotrama ljubarskyi]
MSSENDDRPYAYVILEAPEEATFHQRVGILFIAISILDHTEMLHCQLSWDIAYRGAVLCPRDLSSSTGSSETQQSSLTVTATHSEAGADVDTDDTENETPPASPVSISSTSQDTALEPTETEHAVGRSNLAHVLLSGVQEEGALRDIARGPFTAIEHTYARLPKNVGEELRHPDKYQIYVMNMYLEGVSDSRVQHFEQDPPDSSEFGVAFGKEPIGCNPRVIIDTGTKTSWLLGYGHRKLTTEGKLQDWPSDGVAREVVIKHGYQRNKKGEWELKKGAVQGEVTYSNQERVLLTLMDNPVEVTVEMSYTWPLMHRGPPLRLKLKFGVAYAITQLLRHSPTHGVLGLKPHAYQTRFQCAEGALPATFSQALKSQNVLRQPETGDNGLIYYFGLRKHPQISFLAYNYWPCVKVDDDTQRQIPPWSERIPVVGTEGWDLRLLLMDIEFPSPNGRWMVLNGGMYTFHDEDGHVYLDTGSSLSWLPADFIVHLRTSAFPYSRNASIQERQGTKSQFDADAPDSFVVISEPEALDEARVKLRFCGRGADIVHVYAQLQPFVCVRANDEWSMRHQRSMANGRINQGLLNIAPDNCYILGQNFFQSMFVSLHNQISGILEVAYVRMAPQWPKESSKYGLPL